MVEVSIFTYSQYLYMNDTEQKLWIKLDSLLKQYWKIQNEVKLFCVVCDHFNIYTQV